jgi:hypothetical protein
MQCRRRGLGKLMSRLVLRGATTGCSHGMAAAAAVLVLVLVLVLLLLLVVMVMVVVRLPPVASQARPFLHTAQCRSDRDLHLDHDRPKGRPQHLVHQLSPAHLQAVRSRISLCIACHMRWHFLPFSCCSALFSLTLPRLCKRIRHPGVETCT